MNLGVKIIVCCFLAALTLLVFVGCQQDPSKITGPRTHGTLRTPLNSVTNLEAYSVSDTSVGLTWVPSTSEDSVEEFNDYYIIAQAPDGKTVSRARAAAGESGVVVDSLTEGVTYIFLVTATVADTSKKYINSAPRLIRWAPASRFDTLLTGQPINVYETSDSNGRYSGLIFFDSHTSAPKVVSITNPGDDSLSIDLYVHTETNHRVSIKSASVLHPTWKHTKFLSYNARLSNSLDDPRVTPPDTTWYNLTSLIVDSVAISNSMIYYFKTATGNYGRLLLERNAANGTLLWGKSPAQYLSMKISYQSVPYNRFCKIAPSHDFSEGEELSRP